MAIRDVLRMGDPRLLQPAAPVANLADPGLRELLQDMRDTMRSLDGAGLAAPQIGVPLQVVIFGLERNPRYPEAAPVPDTVLINPVVTPLGDELEEGWEGCLSVPGMRGLVPRWRRIRYQGLDEHGATVDREVEGFHARVVQHEVDHLLGVLYPMRIRDLRHFGFMDAFEAGRFPGAGPSNSQT
ncbi:MAG: peptide deformylase [Gammaproteobacteria bacterium]|nr:peptide deformylase [Gammaproteobacteria bacterium]